MKLCSTRAPIFINSPITVDDNFSPKKLNGFVTIPAEFKETYLKQSKTKFTPKTEVKIFIVYQFDIWS